MRPIQILKLSSPAIIIFVTLIFFKSVQVLYLTTSHSPHTQLVHVGENNPNEPPSNLHHRIEADILTPRSDPSLSDEHVYQSEGLPNAPVIQALCKRDAIRTLFFVHTAPGHFTHRHILRSSIMQSHLVQRNKWSMVFFTGMTKDVNIRAKILKESVINGDIVMLQYIDAYRNLTYKFVHGAKWVADHCPSMHYVVKIDDDILVNVYRLERYIKENITLTDRNLHCRTWTNMGVIRDKKSPWYMSREKYPSDVFPPYCSGSAMVFSAHLLGKLYNASLYMSYLPIDDVYVTGELAVVAMIGHKDLRDLVLFDPKKAKQIVKGDALFGHFPGEGNFKTRRELWERMKLQFTDSDKTDKMDRA